MPLNATRDGPSDGYLLASPPEDSEDKQDGNEEQVCGTCGRFPCHPRCPDH